MTRSELKDLPHIKPEKGPTSLRSAWHRRHLITGGAVLEYGPTEILSPVSPMLPRPVCLCRPRRSSRLGRRGKPWLLDLERRIPARDRFAPDSPLEGGGFEPSVPLYGELGALARATRDHAAMVKPGTPDRSRRRTRRAICGTPRGVPELEIGFGDFEHLRLGSPSRQRLRSVGAIGLSAGQMPK